MAWATGWACTCPIDSSTICEASARLWCYYFRVSATPSAALVKPFGKTKRQMAFVVLVIGVSTLFGTLVKISPPVMDRSQWTSWQILFEVYRGKLPVPGGSFDLGLIDIAGTYLLIVLSLAALLISQPQRVLKAIGGIGIFLSYGARWRHMTFVWTFYGYFGHTPHWRITAGPACYVLPLIMPALLYISFSKYLEQKWVSLRMTYFSFPPFPQGRSRCSRR